jgi:hypothetical protein
VLWLGYSILRSAGQIMVTLEHLDRPMPLASTSLLSVLRFFEYPAAFQSKPSNGPNPHGAGEPWKI